VASGDGEDEVLVAVSLADGARLDPEDLIRFLLPRMAHFMVPRYVRVVDELPKTPTQKVQKHLLRTEGVTADTWDRAAAGIEVKRERIGATTGAGRGMESTMTTDTMLIDCDGHILEPPDLWEKYLEPRYRDRAIRIRVGDDGFEYLEIDGKRAVLPRPGQLGNLGGMGQRVDEAKHLRERAMRGEIRPEEMRGIRPDPERTYLRGAGFGTMDMKERVELLDREGLAKAILYPTIGLLWEAELMDPELSAAYCRAYNRWIADFCRDSGGRLIPIAHLSLGDPSRGGRGARARRRGWLPWRLRVPVHDHASPPRRPRHDRVFAAAQDLDVPLAIHPTFEPPAWGIHHRYDKFGWAVWYFDLFAGQGVQHAFATLFQLGVFLRFPRLRVVVLESQAGWIGYFLDRADAIFSGTTLGATVRLEEPPSYYFQAPVLHLGRPRRADHRRADAARRRGQVLLGQRLPASRPSRQLLGGAAPSDGTNDGIGPPRDPGGKRGAAPTSSRDPRPDGTVASSSRGGPRQAEDNPPPRDGAPVPEGQGEPGAHLPDGRAALPRPHGRRGHHGPRPGRARAVTRASARGLPGEGASPLLATRVGLTLFER
jgi:predicted TIM-barrel fold metal-dependent hydrolase